MGKCVTISFCIEISTEFNGFQFYSPLCSTESTKFLCNFCVVQIFAILHTLELPASIYSLSNCYYCFFRHQLLLYLLSGKLSTVNRTLIETQQKFFARFCLVVSAHGQLPPFNIEQNKLDSHRHQKLFPLLSLSGNSLEISHNSSTSTIILFFTQ